MAGKLCAGRAATEIRNGLPKDSKAFCEGVKAGAHASNPHATGSSAFVAFDKGTHATPGHADTGCCAEGSHAAPHP